MTDDEREIKRLIAKFEDLPENQGSGGHLHILLEDQNAETDHVEWCRDRCAEHGDDLGKEICDRLLKLPFNRRYRIAETGRYEDLAEPPHWIEFDAVMMRTGLDGGGAIAQVNRAGFTIWPESAECYEDHAHVSGEELGRVIDAMLWHEKDWLRRTGRA